MGFTKYYISRFKKEDNIFLSIIQHVLSIDHKTFRGYCFFYEKNYFRSDQHYFMIKSKIVCSMSLQNGEKVKTDHLVVAVGVEPDLQLAHSSNLEIDPVHGGFKVSSTVH